MKVEFEDNEDFTEISLTPESVEETAQLMRFAANTKRETPDIYMSFYGKVYCSVSTRKRKDKIWSINNKN
jgi:hypothetical protein